MSDMINSEKQWDVARVREKVPNVDTELILAIPIFGEGGMTSSYDPTQRKEQHRSSRCTIGDKNKTTVQQTTMTMPTEPAPCGN